MKYCKDALKLLKVKVVCGKDCPRFPCLRLTVEDVMDDAIEEIIKRDIRAMIKARAKKQ